MPNGLGELNRIIIVTDSLAIDGGSGRVALTSARALAERGFATTVFAAAGEADEDAAHLTFVSTDQGTILEDSNVFAAALRGLYNLGARKSLSALLAECDPLVTIVHVHGWTKALSASIFDAIIESGIPLVVTLHEYFLACPTGSLYLHGREEICHITPMSAACIFTNCDSRSYAHKTYRVMRQFVQRDIVRVPARLQKVVTVSRFSREVLSRILPAGMQIDVLRNPVDIPAGPRTRAERNSAFVFVGRLSAEKGAAFFAEAARKANVEAVFIGDGEDREKVRRVNREARIVGWVKASQVVDELRASRTVVLPSLWYETFGLVVREGAALGIPAIVPSGTAPSELIVNGTTGSHFERGNIDSLTEKLVAHAEHELVAEMSQQAFDAYWADPDTIDVHVERILETYADVRKSFFVGPETDCEVHRP